MKKVFLTLLIGALFGLLIGQRNLYNEMRETYLVQACEAFILRYYSDSISSRNNLRCRIEVDSKDVVFQVSEPNKPQLICFSDALYTIVPYKLTRCENVLLD